MHELTIRTRRDGPVAVLTLSGEARLERIAPLRKEAKAVRAAGARHVLLGLSGVTFADSASVGAFLQIQQDLAPAGGRLVLFGCPPRLARQIGDMGLSARFSTCADEAEARRALS